MKKAICILVISIIVAAAFAAVVKTSNGWKWNTASKKTTVSVMADIQTEWGWSW